MPDLMLAPSLAIGAALRHNDAHALASALDSLPPASLPCVVSRETPESAPRWALAAAVARDVLAWDCASLLLARGAYNRAAVVAAMRAPNPDVVRLVCSCEAAASIIAATAPALLVGWVASAAPWRADDPDPDDRRPCCAALAAWRRVAPDDGAIRGSLMELLSALDAGCGSCRSALLRELWKPTPSEAAATFRAWVAGDEHACDAASAAIRAVPPEQMRGEAAFRDAVVHALKSADTLVFCAVCAVPDLMPLAAEWIAWTPPDAVGAAARSLRVLDQTVPVSALAAMRDRAGLAGAAAVADVAVAAGDRIDFDDLPAFLRVSDVRELVPWAPDAWLVAPLPPPERRSALRRLLDSADPAAEALATTLARDRVPLLRACPDIDHDDLVLSTTRYETRWMAKPPSAALQLARNAIHAH